jgi:hypothetical protein
MTVDPKASLYVGVGVRLTVYTFAFGDPDSPVAATSVTLDALLHEGTTDRLPGTTLSLTEELPGTYQAVLDTTGFPPGRYVYRIRATTAEGVAMHENEFALLPLSAPQNTTPAPVPTPGPAVLHGVEVTNPSVLTFHFDPPLVGPSPDHYVLMAKDTVTGVEQVGTVTALLPVVLRGTFTAMAYECWIVAVANTVTGPASDHVFAQPPIPITEDNS